MILGGTVISQRLGGGQIFRPGTWSSDCIKEASYTLRVAPDGMMVNEQTYPPGWNFPDASIRVDPGAIVILSTMEHFNMPYDLVGHPGIRFDYALRGLTGLMGIQVDPLYGSSHEDERLYLRFANLGNEPVVIRPGDRVFNIEFHKMDGNPVANQRQRMWDRISALVERQAYPNWSYATRVQADLESEVESVRRGPETVVMFGVFLVAATLLGVVVTLLLTFRDTPAAEVPPWVTEWGWRWLIAVISVATVITAGMGLAGIYRFLGGTRRR